MSKDYARVQAAVQKLLVQHGATLSAESKPGAAVYFCEELLGTRRTVMLTYEANEQWHISPTHDDALTVLDPNWAPDVESLLPATMQVIAALGDHIESLGYERSLTTSALMLYAQYRYTPSGMQASWTNANDVAERLKLSAFLAEVDYLNAAQKFSLAVSNDHMDTDAIAQQIAAGAPPALVVAMYGV